MPGQEVADALHSWSHGVSFQFAVVGAASLPQLVKHRISASKTTCAYAVVLRSATPCVACVRS